MKKIKVTKKGFLSIATAVIATLTSLGIFIRKRNVRVGPFDPQA